MKFITFYRESNNFADILTDKNLPKIIPLKISWRNHLKLGFADYNKKNESIISYINIKYGDSIVSNLCKDRTPVPYKDYIPIRRK
jgi:hypothetical protein